MMIFALNIVLSIVWSALWNSFSVAMLTSGFLVGYLVLWLCRGLVGDPRQVNYFCTLPQAIVLALYFTKELVLSCINVARDVIAPRPRLNPAIVKMPLDAKSDLEIFLVANLISLTPGTLTLDVAHDKSFLLIHSIYADDPDALVAELKSGMEYRVRKVFQP
ncbi:Na+/H+ antiporter subunit E [Ochrobactrum sp. MYb379]|uniref:Na+/H+ antiporter subunit E n=1 Tax=Ochrobactrum sp. MYb379 TaxID=2745275 RepID=UPI00309FC5C2